MDCKFLQLFTTYNYFSCGGEHMKLVNRVNSSVTLNAHIHKHMRSTVGR